MEPLADFVASAFALVPTGFERGNRGALGRIWREVEGTLADLPAEHAETDDEPSPAAGADELSQRRARRTG